MCGIIGIISKSGNVVENVVTGLKRLEYRGYDSAGVATIDGGAISRVRAAGKIANLEKLLKEEPIKGSIAVGHTRWATHGVPNQDNAHPHATDDVAVVHNGIIENFADLRAKLEKKGCKFLSDTDTEVIPHLISLHLKEGKSFSKAVAKTISELEGAFALGIIYIKENILVAARKGSPLAVGYTDDATYIGSDAIALAPFTTSITYLEDGDIAYLKAGETPYITDIKGVKQERKVVLSNSQNVSIGKENYKHFMLKEIFEQPVVVSETLNNYLNPVQDSITLPDMPISLKKVENVHIIACGTSFYAGQVAKYWLEEYAGVSVHVDIASEFRYRPLRIKKNSIAICISQSGETADTLAGLRYIKEESDCPVVAVVNVPSSTMAREADALLHTFAGPEIGVASTKAFTTQLITLACFTLEMGRQRGVTNEAAFKRLSQQLVMVPARIAEILSESDNIDSIAQACSHSAHMIYIGRGVCYPMAREGALKLKEISYIHAEANAAGELKHGSIALIDEEMPVVALAPSDKLFDKTASNIQEVAARGGKIIMVGDKKGIKELSSVIWKSICIPEANDFTSPILCAIPVQLLAYHIANAKGTDIDQPRNLAKSVTVE